MRKVIVFTVFLVFTWVCYIGFIVWSYGKGDTAKNADCAIVLGAAVWGTTPSPVFEERIHHAINLYNQGRVKKIIFTGGIGDKAAHAESEVGANYAILAGVLELDIYVETTSHTTQQNLVDAQLVMQKNFMTTAIIVSDPFHLKRASIMAQDLGMLATTSPTPTSRYRTLRSKTLFLMREVYFINHYFITGH